MTEKLLQYIWQGQYLNTDSLYTIAGESLEIMQPGKWNTHQGPDFILSRIRLNDTQFAGNIELHLKTSDWDLHKHHWDPNYRNVVLHVVWEHDTVMEHTNNIPILELKNRVSKLLLDQYKQWMDLTEKIPCSGQLIQVPNSVMEPWTNLLTKERLFRKTTQIKNWLLSNEQHWEEVCWWLIARHFGSPNNSDAFESLARSIPYPVLLRNRNQIHQIEALLLGQAGLLAEPFQEAYPEMLRREYQFQQLKFQLEPVHHPFHFLRMRPGNFPTVRLAQLAMLLNQNQQWLEPILHSSDPMILSDTFKVTANDYWHYHYMPDSPTTYLPKTTGKKFLHHLMINAVCPLQYAYGFLMGEEQLIERAQRWLKLLEPEKHSGTELFQKEGIKIVSAFESQAFLELKTSYCDHKRCLDCSVGHYLLKQSSLDKGQYMIRTT